MINLQTIVEIKHQLVSLGCILLPYDKDTNPDVNHYLDREGKKRDMIPLIVPSNLPLCEKIGHQFVDLSGECRDCGETLKDT